MGSRAGPGAPGRLIGLLVILAFVAGCSRAGPGTALPTGTSTSGGAAQTATQTPPSQAGSPSGGPGSSPSSSPLPSTAGLYGVRGTVIAAPTCALQREGDSMCLPRPIAGATILAVRADGTIAGRAITNASGTYILGLPAGTYTLEPQRVGGMMHVAAPVRVVLSGSELVTVDLHYDTGIR